MGLVLTFQGKIVIIWAVRVIELIFRGGCTLRNKILSGLWALLGVGILVCGIVDFLRYAPAPEVPGMLRFNSAIAGGLGMYVGWRTLSYRFPIFMTRLLWNMCNRRWPDDPERRSCRNEEVL